MSAIDKLIVRFKSVPKDFTWNELIRLLTHFGYEELSKGKTGGSRVKFCHSKNQDIINLHRPHPKPVVKDYMMRQILQKLMDEGHIT